jgi:hypothetical protein
LGNAGLLVNIEATIEELDVVLVVLVGSMMRVVVFMSINGRSDECEDGDAQCNSIHIV